MIPIRRSACIFYCRVKIEAKVGAVEIRCINTEGDNEVVKEVKGKGLIEVTEEELA